MRVLVGLVFFFSFMFANSTMEFHQSLGYAKNFADATAKAKRENKAILLVLDGNTCPWCRKLENQVLKKEQIDSFIQKHFVAVIIDRDEGVYPKEFTPKGIPTTYLIDANTLKGFEELVGYKPKNEYLEFLQNAIKKYQSK